MSESAFYNINMNGTREPGESYEDFRTRIKSLKERIKLHKKGRVMWNSRLQVTYIKDVHGPLK